MKVIALVDGEHYPAVTRWGLSSAAASGYDVLAALAVGGAEKLDRERALDLGGVPVLRGEVDPMGALAAAIDELRPDAVLDLSDEPVLSYERRMELAAVALARGCAYVGPGFRFDPPVRDARHRGDGPGRAAGTRPRRAWGRHAVRAPRPGRTR